MVEKNGSQKMGLLSMQHFSGRRKNVAISSPRPPIFVVGRGYFIVNLSA
jgi:hypothetical protein